MVHSGPSLNGGHYYSYARELMTSTAETSSWYVFDDSNVSSSSFERFKNRVKKSPDHTAYVLFYKKVQPPTIQPLPLPVPKLNEMKEDEQIKFALEQSLNDSKELMPEMTEEEQISLAKEQVNLIVENDNAKFLGEIGPEGDGGGGPSSGWSTVSNMTEDEQLKFALEQSLNDSKELMPEMTEEEQMRLALEQSLNEFNEQNGKYNIYIMIFYIFQLFVYIYFSLFSCQ